MCIICTRTNRPYFSNKPHCSTTIRVKRGSGLGYLYVHIRVATCLNEIKKGGETSKSKNSSILKKRDGNMHKKQRRQGRDGLVMMTR